MSYSVRTLWLLFLLMALSGWAAAEKELELIDGLLAQRRYDQALAAAEKAVLKRGLPKETKTRLELQLILIRWEWARENPQNSTLRSRLHSEAQKLSKEFIEKHPDHPGIYDMELEQILVQSRLGLYLKDQIGRGTARKKDIYHAEQIFQNAAKKLERLRSTLRDRKNEIEEKWFSNISQLGEDKLEKYLQRINRTLLRVELELPEVYYGCAKLLEGIEPKRSKNLLEKAASKFGECAFDWKEQAPSAYLVATARYGQCLGDLQKYEEALKKFDEVLAGVGANANSHAQYAKRLAYVGKAETLNALGRYRETIDTVDRFISQKTKTGWQEGGNEWSRCLIQKGNAFGLIAEAQNRDNDSQWRRSMTNAADAVTPVASKSPGQTRETARKMLCEWIGKLGKGSAQQFLICADELFRAGKLVDAIDAYEAARTNASPESKELIGRAWQGSGLCYISLQRYPEAALACKQAAAMLPEGSLEAENAYYLTFVTLHKIYNAARNGSNAEGLAAALEAYLERFPGGEHADRAQYLHLRVEFDRGNYRRTLAGAEKVREASPYYLETLLIKGRAYQAMYNKRKQEEASAAEVKKLAEQSAATLERFVSEAQTAIAKAPDGQKTVQIRAWAAYGKVILADVYLTDELRAPDRAIALVEKIKEEHPESGGMAAQLDYLLLRANVQQGRLEKAGEFLTKLTQVDKEGRLTRNGIGILIKAYETLAEKTSDRAIADKLRLRQAELVGMLEGEGECVEARSAALLASRQREAGQIELAIRTLQKAIRDNSNNEECARLVRRDMSYNLGQCYIEAKEWRTAVQVFENLDNNYPEVADFVEGLALSYEGAGRFAKAQETWEGLWQRRERASPEWFFAKYHIASCLFGQKKYADTRGFIENLKFFYDDEHEVWKSVEIKYPGLKKSIDELLQKARIVEDEK